DPDRGMGCADLHLPSLRDRPRPSHDDAGAADLRAEGAWRGVHDNGRSGAGISGEASAHLGTSETVFKTIIREATMNISRRDILAGGAARAATAAGGRAAGR